MINERYSITDCLNSDELIIEILKRNMNLLKFYYKSSWESTFANARTYIYGLKHNRRHTSLLPTIINDFISFLVESSEYKSAFELIVFFDNHEQYIRLYEKIMDLQRIANTTDTPKEILKYSRKKILEYHPSSSDAVDFKYRILEEYCWAWQPRDCPASFSSDFYDEIYDNVYESINEKNAGIHYWYLLTRADWCEFMSGRYNVQINAMKIFFDNFPYIYYTSSLFKRDKRARSEVARLYMLSFEAYSDILSYYNPDKPNAVLTALANYSESAFYLEMFFLQQQYSDFSIFVQNESQEIEKVRKSYIKKYLFNNTIGQCGI